LPPEAVNAEHEKPDANAETQAIGKIIVLPGEHSRRNCQNRQARDYQSVSIAMYSLLHVELSLIEQYFAN